MRGGGPVSQGDVKSWVHRCGATVTAVEGDTVDCPGCGDPVFTGSRNSRFARCDLACTVDCSHCRGDHALVLDWTKRDRDSWRLLANTAQHKLARYQYPGTPTYEQLLADHARLLDERDEWLRGIAEDARELQRMLRVVQAAEAWVDLDFNSPDVRERTEELVAAVDAHKAAEGGN